MFASDTKNLQMRFWVIFRNVDVEALEYQKLRVAMNVGECEPLEK